MTLVNNDFLTFSLDANPRLGYINLAYALETNMEASLASSFPSQFGTYLDLAKSINTDNPCQSNTTATTGIQENLSKINNRLRLNKRFEK